MKHILGPERRLTRQRRVILEELKKLKCHPTADELYTRIRDKMPSISLGTVYRNLEVLTECGLIQTLEGVGSKKRFDGNPMSHPHVVCVQCGRVEDVPAMDMDRFIQAAKSVQSDYRILGLTVILHGLCPQCRQMKNTAPGQDTSTC